MRVKILLYLIMIDGDNIIYNTCSLIASRHAWCGALLSISHHHELVQICLEIGLQAGCGDRNTSSVATFRNC